MKAVIVASLTAIALAGPAFADAVIGQAAPDFTAVTTQNETITLSELEGLVVLEWTNHGCPFVKKHYKSGNMQATQTKAVAQGATWISIISSAKGKQGHVSAEKANSLTDERAAKPTHVVLDASGEIGRLYGAQTTPHMYVINNQTLEYAGAIDSIPSGNVDHIEKAENYVLSALSNIAAGEAVVTPFSKAYGCDVKYGS